MAKHAAGARERGDKDTQKDAGEDAREATDAAAPAESDEAEEPAEPDEPDTPGVDAQESETDAAKPPASPLRSAAIVGVAIVVALAGAVGWLWFHTAELQRSHHEREIALQVGRQAAASLTSLDWQHADADAQRVLALATGPFYDDFSRRAQSMVEVAKQVKSRSEGTVTDVGLLPESAKGTRVLASVIVKTANVGAPEHSQAWRMVLTVQQVGGDTKVSNVEFMQ